MTLRSLAADAAPMILSRAGFAAMTMVGAALVARHDATELATLNLSDGTFGRVADICFAALLSGAPFIAGARAPADAATRFVAFRRAVAAALALGLLAILIATQAPAILVAIGQKPALATGAARVAFLVALGLPGGLIAVAAAVHLEAIGRAVLVTRAMLAANVLNLALGAILINGGFGVPAFGARGAALAAALVRLALAVWLVWTLRAVEGPGLFARVRTRVPAQRQLSLGAAAAGISAGMHALGIWMTLFASWLGPLALSSFASAWTLNLPGFVIALGVADALAIRTAARGRDNQTLRSDLATLLAALAVIAFALAVLAGPISHAYTRDPALQDLLASLLPLSGVALFLDGGGLGVFAALRARGDIATPTAIQIGSMAAAIALGGALALGAHLGPAGLFYAILPTSAARLALMLARLGRAAPQTLAPEPSA